MSDLSQNFNRSEFECPCGCGYNTVDAELIAVLEKMRKAFIDKPIKINSGCRCVQHNAKISGAEKSQHRYGKAADIVVVGVESETVADYLESTYPDQYGIGRYHERTHIDVRSTVARWDKRGERPKAGHYERAREIVTSWPDWKKDLVKKKR